MSHTTITIDGHTVTVTGPDADGLAQRLAAGEPASGNWISADDYRDNVKALDVALNGPGGASRPSLIDVLSQVEQTSREQGMPVLVALARAQSPHEGWKLVPVEPTPEMVKAGNRYIWPLPSAEAYKAMLAASPAQPVRPSEIVEATQANPTNNYLFKLMCARAGIVLGVDRVDAACKKIDSMFAQAKPEQAEPSPAQPVCPQASQPQSSVRAWQDRIKDTYPQSQLEYWPDALKVEYMEREILELRALVAQAKPA